MSTLSVSSRGKKLVIENFRILRTILWQLPFPSVADVLLEKQLPIMKATTYFNIVFFSAKFWHADSHFGVVTSQLIRIVQIFGSYPSIDNFQNLIDMFGRQIGAVFGWYAPGPLRGGGGVVMTNQDCSLPVFVRCEFIQNPCPCSEACNRKIEPDADPG